MSGNGPGRFAAFFQRAGGFDQPPRAGVWAAGESRQRSTATGATRLRRPPARKNFALGCWPTPFPCERSSTAASAGWNSSDSKADWPAGDSPADVLPAALRMAAKFEELNGRTGSRSSPKAQQLRSARAAGRSQPTKQTECAACQPAPAPPAMSSLFRLATFARPRPR